MFGALYQSLKLGRLAVLSTFQCKERIKIRNRKAFCSNLHQAVYYIHRLIFPMREKSHSQQAVDRGIKSRESQLTSECSQNLSLLNTLFHKAFMDDFVIFQKHFKSTVNMWNPPTSFLITSLVNLFSHNYCKFSQFTKCLKWENSDLQPFQLFVF